MIFLLRKHYISFYIFTVFCLFLYSFTQVDLGLTLTQASFWQILQRSMQSIGYFQRPLSAQLYVGIISLLTLFYWYFMILAKKGEIKVLTLWKIILVTSLILTFSYTAFSHDLFNYVFDAKIVTHYNQNPYEHKALDYPGDPMLGFMHWTHRTYPYGPAWLAITVPLSYLGMGFFLPTLIFFKALMGASFIGSVYIIRKILEKTMPEKTAFGMALFALNPLVLIESLVSSHLDIVMLFFALFAMYVLIQKKYIASFFLLFISIAIKFATIFLLPVFLYALYIYKQDKKLEPGKFFVLAAVSMVPTILIASMRTNFQPWYVVTVLPFFALFGKSLILMNAAVTVSFIILLHYVPYLYTGNWDPPIPYILTAIATAASFVSIGAFLLWGIKRK